MRSPKDVFDLRAALTEEVRAAIEEFEASADDVQALHRCRVRLKRARALARVGEGCAPGLSAVFVDSIRVVMRALAQRRDLAALSETARSLAGKSRRSAAAGLHAAAQNFDGERLGLPDVNVDAIIARLKDLLALAQVWPEASPRQLRKGALRVERRAARARRRGRDSLEYAVRHEWRNCEKDRHYAALLLGRSWPGKRRRKVGGELGDVLGEERDATLLMQRISADPGLAGEPRQARRAMKMLAKRGRRLRRRADELAAKLRRRAT